MQLMKFAFLTAVAAVATASNLGCPHPDEAKHLLLETQVVAEAHNEGRQVEIIELPREVIGRATFSCITVVSKHYGHTPDLLSFGLNKMNGYSIIIRSRIRNPINATLYLYGR